MANPHLPVTITVSGAVNTGKSRIALAVARLLAGADLKVSFSEDPPTERVILEDLRPLDVLAGKVSAVVRTRQTRMPAEGHGTSVAERLRLLRALVGTDDPQGLQDMREIIDGLDQKTAGMLEALRAALVYVGDDDTDDSPQARDTRQVIIAAIREAEGRGA